MRLFRALLFFLKYLGDFAVANVVIARQVLSSIPNTHPETVEIPTRVETPLEVLLLSNLVSFTPGTLALEIEPGNRLVIHALDDAHARAEAIRTRIEPALLEALRGSN